MTNGEVAVVTGASSGIGRRTALDLARRGVNVCGAARRQPHLKQLVNEMGGPERGHSYHVTDVSDPEQVAGLAAHVRERYGRCDLLVNNAGVPGPRWSFGGADSLAELDRVMAINFRGAVVVTAALLDLLEASAPSHVVNVASVAGRLTIAGSPAYAASKFALVGWSEALHFELAPRGVHVSLVEPGVVPTEGFPQDRFLRSPLLRRLLTSPAAVSAAIIETAERRKLQRVVPRWYYLLILARYLAPPAYRIGQRQLVTRLTR